MSNTRTITLTGRAPVKIVEEDWPVLADARDDSYGSADYSRHQQALAQGELDTYLLRVRQHADGRAIVYGVLDGASVWTGTESWRGGELVDAEYAGNIPAIIASVGHEGGLPEHLIRECVADLPAEEI